MFDVNCPIGVVGAGAMGAGIAEVAAVAGHPVYLVDTRAEQVAQAQKSLEKNLARSVEKGRLTADAAKAVLSRVQFFHGSLPAALKTCALIVEAIVEDLAIKQDLFRALESLVGPQVILGTNTSSLSIASIASAVKDPTRVVGIHFFNPVPLMALVEIIPGIASAPNLAQKVSELMTRWGKVPVRAKDTPGFIVNRIARPYYSEALRILDEGIADCATIDQAMRELGGFKMGPFELMDFIGNDINFKVTRTVFEATFYNPRYRPSLTQQRLVEAGFFGKKVGRGFYNYRESKPAAGAEKLDPVLGQKIMRRVVVMLMNEAAFGVMYNIASPDEIDLAMQKGVNYPKGLLAWAAAWGHKNVRAELEGLYNSYHEERYAPCPVWQS